MKTYSKPEILQMLTNSDVAVERAILAIYERQTEDEQRAEETKHYNKVGFSGAHAHTGTYLAKWLLSGKHLNGKWSEKGRKLVLHYADQLTDISNTPAKEQEKAMLNKLSV